MTQLVSLTLIRGIAIYPVDSAIQRLNNPGQSDNCDWELYSESTRGNGEIVCF